MDIKTIFYFADNQAEYESNLDNISSRTIVFVQDTGAIYKGGKLFGKMSEDDIKTILLKIYRDDPTSFPTYSTISDLAGQFSNFKTNTNATIENIINTVGNIYNYEQSDIANIAANTIATSQWLKDYIENNPSTSVLKLSDFSTYANSWASGYIIPQANGQNGLTFAQLLAAHNALSLSVSNIKTGVQNSNGVDITTIEQLKSTFDSWLESSEELGNLDTAVAEMRSMWALTLDEDTQNALSWMSASFKTAASRENAFAQVLASASNDAIQTAISGLRTEISTNENGIVSNATASQISNIDNRLSAIETAVEGGVVTTSMISSVTDETTGKITAASIIAKVNEDTSSISISADHLNLSGTTWAINNNGAGYLAGGNLSWNASGGLDIKSDSLTVSTSHLWPWMPTEMVMGLGAICITGDYTNLISDATYDSTTQTWTKNKAKDSQDFEGFTDEDITKDIACAAGSAIFDGSGLGITMLNPYEDADYFDELVSNSTDSTIAAHGINDIHTMVNMRPGPYRTSQTDGLPLRCLIARRGLFIDNNTFVGRGLIANKIQSIRDIESFGKISAAGYFSAEFTRNVTVDNKTQVVRKNLNGITKTVKIGNYYFVFAKGLLVYCDTTSPFAGNNPFIDTNDYAANIWDTNIIDTSVSV